MSNDNRDRDEVLKECTKNRAYGIPPDGSVHQPRHHGYWGRPNLIIQLSPEDVSRRKKLPALASTFHNNLPTYQWNPILYTIFAGVYDNNKSCPLSLLLGNENAVVEHIYSFVGSKWANKVTLTMPADMLGSASYYGTELFRFDEGRVHDDFVRDWVEKDELWVDGSGNRLQGLVSNVSVKMVEFPEPMDRNVNMMPFVFGDKSSLPDYLKCYHGVIEECPYLEEEIGKVGYLTVHESYVEASAAQRRGGIHIENPGSLAGNDDNNDAFTPAREWGCGLFESEDRLEGGMFVASTVADTSVVWDALVNNKVKGIVDRHGGCEHLRPLLGPGKKLKANELVWMTDCTPHEALPVTESGYRQFFRLVSSKVTHWYEEHSTPNPLVPLPDHVVVVKGNKFA